MKLQLSLFINMSVAYEDGMAGIVWFSYWLEMLTYLMTFVTVPICHYIASTAHLLRRVLSVYKSFLLRGHM
ncbi:unnamed protein product, partial [Mesorhabditis belari]|uniref:Uncharacterized protein n=1 Tax=Mesorhabditis belari TaxID=2138241 RepID=A0AAF3ERL1_9BILA